MALLSPDDYKIQESIQKLLSELPPYIYDFQKEKDRHGTSFRTVHQYLKKYKLFFQWLIEDPRKKNKMSTRAPIFNYDDIRQITLKDLESLTKEDIWSFIDELKVENIAPKDSEGNFIGVKHREPRYMASIISALKSLFYFLGVTSENAERNTYISHNIMQKIHIPAFKESSGNRAEEISTEILDSSLLFSFIEWLDDAERGYMAQLTVSQAIGLFKRDKERDIAILSILLATGMRVGELTRIQMTDINYARQTIKILRKGSKKDTVYLMDTAFEKLMAYINIRNKRYRNAEACPFLFVTFRKRAQPIQIRTVEYFVEKYTEAYFETGVYPHKLRHSFAVAFIKNGGEITILRDLLGHIDIKTTSLYVNMANSDKVDALKALNNYLSSSSWQETEAE